MPSKYYENLEKAQKQKRLKTQHTLPNEKIPQPENKEIQTESENKFNESRLPTLADSVCETNSDMVGQQLEEIIDTTKNH